MVPTVAMHPLRASDHRQPEKATAEAALLLDGMRCCGVKCRCSTQATITAHRTMLRRLRQAVRIEANQCDVLLTRVQAARLSSASRRFVATVAPAASLQRRDPAAGDCRTDIADESQDDGHWFLASQCDGLSSR